MKILVNNKGMQHMRFSKGNISMINPIAMMPILHLILRNVHGDTHTATINVIITFST